jgi:ribosomal protein S18 acetylase RimI-like enzyme
MDQGNIEKLEPQITTKVFTSQELIDLVYQGQSLPQDNRFLHMNRGGVFKYFNIADLINPLNPSNEKKLFPIIEQDGKIIGISELEPKPNEPNVAWLKFISVDPAYRGQGFASKLAESVFRYAKENGLSLESSSYSPEGFQKLKALLNRYAQEYDVNFIDTENILR